MVENKGNIFIEGDFDNIFSIDPNRVYDQDGNIQQRLVDHEDLVMYANLECNLLPRTKLQLGQGAEEKGTNVTIATSKINFMNPGGKNFLDTFWTDNFTPKSTLNGDNLKNAKNGPTNDSSKNETYEKNQSFALAGDVTDSTALLGITSIQYKINTSFLPTVTMTLEDVRGRALFELGDQSPYAAFFNLPYPIFYLTLKGFYGKAIKIPISLTTFNASFNTTTGNFQVTLNFYAYKYSMMSEIPTTSLVALPNMFEKLYTIKPIEDPQSSTSDKKQISTTRGREVLDNVYSKYIAKGLIDKDLPKYTIIEFVNVLDKIDKDLSKLIGDVDFSRLTDIKIYAKILSEMNKELITYRGSNDPNSVSWYIRYRSDKNPANLFLKNSDEGKFVNAYKKQDSKKPNQIMDESREDLTKLLTKFEGRLKAVNSFKDIPFNINVDDFYYEDPITNIDKFNLEKSFRNNGGIAPINSTEYTEFTTTLSNLLFEYNSTLSGNQEEGLREKPVLFINYDKYQEKYDKLNKTYQQKKEEIETDISKKIREILKGKLGLGFDPTIRNVMAILFASFDAFIILLDEVHTKSWSVRNEIGRKKLLKDAITDKPDSNTSPVYPWPQVIEIKEENQQQKFTLKYPGETPQGRDSTIWPEVEFVEEFIKGLTRRNNIINSPGQTDNNQLVEVGQTSISTLDFPLSDIIFLDKDEVKFFYEIWERVFMLSFYGGLSKTNDGALYKAIADFEVNNLLLSFKGTSLSLKQKFTQYKFDSSNIISILRSFSNGGLGASWQLLKREIFNTPYIVGNIQQSSIFLDQTQVERESAYKSESEVNFTNFVLNTKTNTQDFFDIYPFNDLNWVKTNLSNGVGQSVETANNTTKSLTYNTTIKTITNYKPEDIYKNEINRPFVNFNYKVGSNYETDFRMDLKDFYNLRTPKDFLPTEGYLRYSATTGLLTKELLQKSTSIMNTPMFINSILTANFKFRNRNKTPYLVPAYLFLNSLPLATLREKNKTYENKKETELDYIFSCFKKFGAIHKIPYAWILKYGSIWHRYKVWLETNNDILTNDWSNFSYIPNYDPVTNDPTKPYNLDVPNLDGTLSSYQIVLDNSVNSPSGIFVSTMNLGFYPNLIDEFNYCYQGLELIGSVNGYTDNSINSVLSDKLRLIPSEITTNSSNVVNPIYRTRGFDPNNSNRTLSINTWSALAYKNSADTQNIKQCFVLPSFGTEMNEGVWECFEANSSKPYFKMKVEVSGNQSIFNGSARLIWGLPNYGYFDFSGITKPTPYQYMKEVFSGTGEQSNFGIQSSNYSDISEIFSTFEKSILDLFEQEFLSFSKSIYDTNIDSLSLENFQSIFRQMMTINEPTSTNFQSYLQEVISDQESNISSIIQSFLNYNKFLKIGNPTNFDRKIFFSFAGLSSGDPISPQVIDPYPYQPYRGNLPPDASFTSSVLNAPTAWEALQLYVGFSFQPGFTYGTQSYITDFFRDMNVEFSEGNIKNLYQLIKLYATQKAKDPTLDRTKFTDLLYTNLQNINLFKNGVIDQIFQSSKLLEEIKDQVNSDTKPNDIDTSEVENKTVKIELWETFKAINDKWIAGGDFETKTFFEDLLFLDRSGKDVGQEIIVDIYKMRTQLTSIFSENLTGGTKTLSNFQVIVDSIIKDNNFQTFPIAGYTNFYGIQTPFKNAKPKLDIPQDFANAMFGTFLDVDVRNSSPKLVCFYTNKGSEQLAIEKPEGGYKNDSWNFSTPVNSPIRNTPTKDYGLNNRAVGFTVDVGLQNQNIFYNVSLNQTPGKATAESIEELNKMANLSDSKGGYAASTSLYNFYKVRSYGCDISMMGNVMIQPMMYFNLRHVPMFEGTYMIIDVQHDIRPGSFETKIQGIRQPIAIQGNVSKDEAIVRIKSMFLDKISEKIVIGENDKPVPPPDEVPATTQGQNNAIINSYSGTKSAAANNDCSQGLTNGASSFAAGVATVTTPTIESIKDSIVKFTDNENGRKILLSLVWLKSASENGKIECFNNNVIGLTLDTSAVDTFISNNLEKFNKEFICVNVGEKQFPFASFKSVENSIFIAFAKFRKIFDTIDVNQKFTPEQTLDTILQYWPTDSPTGDPNGANRPGDQTIKTSNPTEYDNLVRRVKQAFQKGVTLNMWQSTEVNQNQNVSPPSPSATPPAPGVSPTPPAVTPTPTYIPNSNVTYKLEVVCADCPSIIGTNDPSSPYINILKPNGRYVHIKQILTGAQFNQTNALGQAQFYRVSEPPPNSLPVQSSSNGIPQVYTILGGQTSGQFIMEKEYFELNLGSFKANITISI